MVLQRFSWCLWRFAPGCVCSRRGLGVSAQTSPLNRILDTHFWKYYFIAGGKKTKPLFYVPQISQGHLWPYETVPVRIRAISSSSNRWKPLLLTSSCEGWKTSHLQYGVKPRLRQGGRCFYMLHRVVTVRSKRVSVSVKTLQHGVCLSKRRGINTTQCAQQPISG